MEVVSAVLSPIFLVLGLSGSYAATARVIRHRTTEGVSLTSSLLGLMANCTWTLYGVLHREPIQLINNVPQVFGVLAVFYVAWRTRHLAKPSKMIAALVVYGLFVFFMVQVVGPVALSCILVALAVVARIPQLVESWRAPGGEGLSVASFALLISASLGWAVYGMIHGQGAVIATSAYCVLAYSFIVARTVQGRRTAVAVTPAPERVVTLQAA